MLVLQHKDLAQNGDRVQQGAVPFALPRASTLWCTLHVAPVRPFTIQFET